MEALNRAARVEAHRQRGEEAMTGLFWKPLSTDPGTGGTPTENDRLRAELTRLRSDLEKAKEALKPFANEWEVNWTGLHNYTDDDGLPLDDLTGCTLDAGHLRTAARILSELENSK
jgi:hypothetical protein